MQYWSTVAELVNMCQLLFNYCLIFKFLKIPYDNCISYFSSLSISTINHYCNFFSVMKSIFLTIADPVGLKLDVAFQMSPPCYVIFLTIADPLGLKLDVAPGISNVPTLLCYISYL